MTTSPAEHAASPSALAAEADLAAPEGAVTDSLTVAAWTIISRLTGVLRGITVAAVLGATYFANTYQFTNSLPNLIFYGLLAGSLFSSLLVPALVPHIDSGNRWLAARTAGSLLGVAMAGMLVIIPLVALATPWLLRLGAVGAADPAAAKNQAAAGAILVLLLLPQVPLYAIVGTATSVMNAHRRFALAAAAPAIENLGTIAVLGAVAVRYSRAARQHGIPMSLLLILGLGTTGAVLLHAGVQWWGARRLGVTLLPRAGWRDPDVRAMLRRALPAASQAALVTVQLGMLLVVANRVAGGVVALQLAMNFYFLPIAIGAAPVAVSLVPRLSRMTASEQGSLFRDTYLRGVTLASFVTVPAAAAYLVLAAPLANAVAFGGFRTEGGAHLIAASLTGLAPGVVGETLFLLTTYACYARHDAGYPLRGMVIQAVVCTAVVAAALPLRSPDLLTALGLGFSAGSICAALYLMHHIRRRFPPGGERALASLARSVAGAAVMAGPAAATARFLASRVDTPAGRVLAMLAASVLGSLVYFAVQAVLRASQMAWVAGAMRGWQLRALRRHAAPARASGNERQRPRWNVAGSAPRRCTGWRVPPRIRIDLALFLCCIAVGGLAAVSLKYAVVAVVVLGLAGWVTAVPAVAAYLLIFLTPLIVGVNAGTVIPFVRPNEALMVLLGVILALRWVVRARTGDRRRPRIDRVDASLIALGVTSSILPLLVMAARQRSITSDDIVYSLAIWKLIAEYVIVRSAVSTREQAMRCLMLSMLSAAVVCIVGVLQTLRLFGVPALLAHAYAPLGVASAVQIGRGSSLLALPAAVGDLAILNLGIAVAMLARGHPRRGWLRALAVVYVLGVLAAAEFSTAIGLIVALASIIWLTKWRRLIGYAIPVTAVGAVLLWPVIQTRLSAFHGSSHLPLSWLTRLQNLRTYYWPTLFSDYNWVLGVRPAARVVAPDQQYGYVWIESGYTWLLWGGGIPLLASYIALAVATLRKGLAYTRRADTAGIVGTAMVVVMCTQVVLMAIDPHLTYRGSGDAFFMLLALLRILPGRGSDMTQIVAARMPSRHTRSDYRMAIPIDLGA